MATPHPAAGSQLTAVDWPSSRQDTRRRSGDDAAADTGDPGAPRLRIAGSHSHAPEAAKSTTERTSSRASASDHRVLSGDTSSDPAQYVTSSRGSFVDPLGMLTGL